MLLAVTVLAGLGVGLVGGLLLKGAGNGNSKLNSATGASLAKEPIPAVPALRAIGTLPALRTAPKRHPSLTTGASASSSSSSSSSSLTTAPATHPTQIPDSSGSAVSTQAASPSPPPKQTPSHSEGSEVHHESGGGA